jgi:hypothetical protein
VPPVLHGLWLLVVWIHALFLVGIMVYGLAVGAVGRCFLFAGVVLLVEVAFAAAAVVMFLLVGALAVALVIYGVRSFVGPERSPPVIIDLRNRRSLRG